MFINSTLRRASVATDLKSGGFKLDPKYIRQFVFQVHPDRLVGSEAREVNAENLATFNAMTTGQVKGNEVVFIDVRKYALSCKTGVGSLPSSPASLRRRLRNAWTIFSRRLES